MHHIRTINKDHQLYHNLINNGIYITNDLNIFQNDNLDQSTKEAYEIYQQIMFNHFPQHQQQQQDQQPTTNAKPIFKFEKKKN